MHYPLSKLAKPGLLILDVKMKLIELKVVQTQRKKSDGKKCPRKTVK